MDDVKLSFIGSFECQSGDITVLDTQICPINIEMDAIDKEMQTMVKVSGAFPGTYKCYHIVSNIDFEIFAFMAIHKDFEYAAIKSFHYTKIGDVSALYGQNIAFTDSSYLFCSDACYYPVYEEAYYDPDRLKEDLTLMPYDDGTKKMLSEIAYMAKKRGKYVRGIDILDCIQCNPVWGGFGTYGASSSAWSVDCKMRLDQSYFPAASIPGGIITEISSGIYPVYVYKDPVQEKIAFIVSYFK